LNESGVMTWLTTKAMGQAMRKLFGQIGRKAAPRAMKPMMPDMASAMEKVIRSWARNRVFLDMVGSVGKMH